MEITNETIDHIAHLSRLRFEGDEKVAIKADMEKIVSFMGKLSELDTDGLEPLIFMNPEINVLREDEPKITLTQKEALKNGPKTDSDYFRIPKVLDK